uniref:Myb/SANT-like DNA-binding domain-containing protein n=1 Tax=Chelydra serpentina TaxID=8475 RepID=A0A8C3SPU4_CHESE
FPVCSAELATMQSSTPEVTMQSHNRKGAPAWSDREVLDLIAVWGDESVLSELRSKRRNAKIYEKISLLGFERTPEQCRIRIKGLKRQYYQARDGLKKNGHARKICKYYDEMDRILSCRGGPDSAPEPLAQPADGGQPAAGPPTPGTPHNSREPDTELDEDAELESPHDHFTEDSGECSSYAEHPIKVECPPFAIPVPPAQGEYQQPGRRRAPPRLHAGRGIPPPVFAPIPSVLPLPPVPQYNRSTSASS